MVVNGAEESNKERFLGNNAIALTERMYRWFVLPSKINKRMRDILGHLKG